MPVAAMNISTAPIAPLLAIQGQSEGRVDGVIPGQTTKYLKVKTTGRKKRGLSKGTSRFDSRGCLLARVASVKLDAFDSDQDDEGSDVAKED